MGGTTVTDSGLVRRTLKIRERAILAHKELDYLRVLRFVYFGSGVWEHGAPGVITGLGTTFAPRYHFCEELSVCFTVFGCHLLAIDHIYQSIFHHLPIDLQMLRSPLRLHCIA